MEIPLDRIASIVARHLPGTSSQAIGPDTDLRDAGLDSIRIVALLVDIEREADVQLSPARIVPATFCTVRSLAEAVAASSSD